MSIAATNWAFSEIRIGNLSAGERLCLLCLAHHHNAKTGRCDPSASTIASQTGLSRRSVVSAVQGLDLKGIISVEARSTRGGRTSNQHGLHIREIEPGKEYVAPTQKGGVRGKFKPSKAKRNRVYRRDGHACVYCGATEDLSLDHVVPRSKGGSDGEDNLVTCCRSCNSKKGAKRLQQSEVWRISQSEVGGTLLEAQQSEAASHKHKNNHNHCAKAEKSARVDFTEFAENVVVLAAAGSA